MQRFRQAESELELGDNGLLSETRKSAGWRLRLWRHRGEGAGLDFTV